MKNNNDTKFWLTSFFLEQEQTKPEYLIFKMQIEDNGCFIVNSKTYKAKIYTAGLAFILTSKELPARNMDTNTETTINGWDYLETFIAGFKEGEQYFEAEFKASSNTLYGANAEQYVKDIHTNFFHVQHTEMIKGWGDVKKHYPTLLTHKIIKEYGYYSGIVNKVEEQIKKHPQLFATFDKCEHDLIPQPIVKPKEALSDLITHKKSVEIVESIKIQYKNIKGKRLKILLLAFQNLGLLPKERIAQKFYNCCKNEFEWNIASYNAMNGYNFNERTDNNDFIAMKQNIESLTKTN